MIMRPLAALGVAALLSTSLTACPPWHPCGTPGLPPCLGTPTPGVTAGVTPRPEPTPSRTPGPSTRTPAPTGTRTPGPGTVEPFPVTQGRMVVRVDLRDFVPVFRLDYYVVGTLLWEPPPAHGRPHSPALELSVRGIGPELCRGPGRCPDGSLGLVARWSSNLAAYREGESDPCGEGINSAFRLPIGTEPVFDVAVDWAPGLVRVTGPTGKSWSARVGVDGPGFGLWTPGIPERPIGWAYLQDWTIAAHGGAAVLREWTATGEQGAIEACP